MNRTGVQSSPVDSKDLLQGSQRATPTSGAGDESDADIRTEYTREADLIGSVPPPGTISGVAKTGVQMLSGNRPQVVLDKLAQRLAFERGGTRLYDALIAKARATPEMDDVVPLAQLVHIRDEELHHFHLVSDAIEALGGDPTAQTPMADVTGMESMGLVQVLNDPRTTMAQSLDAILIAELGDNAGWEMLITLMQQTGNDKFVAGFSEALEHEREHVLKVRTWLEQLTAAEAKLVGDGT
jgi:hypothetical protein